MTSLSEYQRLGGHLPDEVGELVREFAAPIYRRPYHTKCIDAMFGLLKEHAISWALFNDSILYSSTSSYEGECVHRLRRKQLGEICEDEHIDIAIDSFVPYLIERNVLVVR